MTPKLFICLVVTLLTVFAAPDWTNLNNMVQNAIDNGVFPGAAISVCTSKATVYTNTYGYYQYKKDLYQPFIKPDTKWDLDRVSQVVSLVPTYMHLIDNGKMNVTDHVSKYEFDFDNNGKKNISFQNMMLHNSGFEAEYPGVLPVFPSTLISHINSAKLTYNTSTKTLYSSEGMVVLGEAIAKISNKTLENYVYQVNVQIGLRNTNYLPEATEFFRVAPTSYTTGKGLLHGRPFNAMADLLNGTAGHAGIFSTIGDVTRMMRLILGGGQIGNEARMFQKETVDLFTTKVTGLSYNNTRALIFDTIPDEPVKVTGNKFSANSFGLYGLTGTFAWGDKDKDVAIVILTNSAYPNGAGIDKFKEACGKMADEIMTQMGY